MGAAVLIAGGAVLPHMSIGWKKPLVTTYIYPRINKGGLLNPGFSCSPFAIVSLVETSDGHQKTQG
jgi:hypothetical protein